MTSKPGTISTVALSVAAALTLAIAPAQAQEGFGDMQNRAVTAMRAGNWQDALAITKDITDNLGGRGQQMFGSKFGWFYFYQGMSQLNLKQFDEAAKSFEICYTQFPNDNSAKAGNDKTGGINVKHSESLLRWGQALLASDDFDGAVEKFKKFADERKRSEKFDQGAYFVNLAVANLKKTEPDIAEGVKSLQTAINNKVAYKVSDGQMMQGIRALVALAVATENEQVLVDFLEQNRAALTLKPAVSHVYAPLFLREAADASNRGLFRTAFTLYGLVPSIEEAIADIESTLASFEPLGAVRDGNARYSRAQLEKQLAALKVQSASDDNYESAGLRAMAVIQEKMGNRRGAFAAYREMNDRFPNNKNREADLYNLIRTASAVSETNLVEEYGNQFLSSFPTSKQVGTVERLLLSSLFYKGKYEKVIELGKPIEKTLEQGTERHDNTLHFLGASYYYEGRYFDAEKPLNEHVKLYPKSKNVMAARFLQASNASRIQDTGRAGVLLGKFVKDYPDQAVNPYLPFALFDQASVFQATEKYEEALTGLNRIQKDFPSASIIELAVNLKGNVLENLEKPGDAEKAYKTALEIAERRDQFEAAGDSLAYLVSLIGKDKKRSAEAIPFYEKFWEKYSTNSPLRPQVAVSGLPPMRAAGRTKEGLEKLQIVISDMAKTANASILEKTINSYTEAYLEDHTAEQLKDHFYNFPNIKSEDRATLALLRIAIIGVYEDELKSAKDDPAKVRQASASIKVLFDQLKSDFKPATLSNFILVKLGDYLRTKTGSPKESVAYYRETLVRDDKSFSKEASFGLADVLGNSAELAERKEAVTILNKLAADPEMERGLKEQALYRIVQIHTAAEDWEAVTAAGLAYLNAEVTPPFAKFSPEVSLLYADAFLKRGMEAEALSAYSKAYAANIGKIDISAPAQAAISKLAWKRNGPGNGKESDRQVAYNGAAFYIEQTENLVDRMTAEEKALRAEVAGLVKTYEASGEIKTLAQQKAEKE